jgi:hypothetical protein
MIEARGSQAGLITPQARLRQRWHWQAVLAALLALLAVEGQPVAASYATFNPAGRMIQVSRGIAATGSSADASTSAGAVHETAAPSPDARPDFQVGFAHLDDAQAGRPFSYTLQVHNDGKAGGAVSVNTVLPPELSNVRVTAPGFVCTRRFTASGAQAGTLVTCSRGELEGGGSADVTIEANAPATLGPIHLTAAADPRDDVAEADETNNDADATVEVHA